jgi:hypothetical protein
MGYLNGATGVAANEYVIITEESFAPYRNLGGYDYLGRSLEILAAE